MEPRPDLGLPQAIEALDGRLKARLPGRHKDRDHPQTQAGSRHATDGIGMNLCPFKDRIVVELRVTRQTDRTPVLHQGLHDEIRREDRLRPRHDQTPVERNTIEDLNRRASLDDQAFDHVEAIQLRTAISHSGQVPAGGRRGAAHPSVVIQCPAALQDGANGPDRGRIGDTPSDQFAVDGRGPELAQVTGLAQLLTNGQHEILQRAFRAVVRGGQAAGAVGPVHAIQALFASPCDPALDGGQGHSKAGSDLAQGITSPDSFDHLAPLLTAVGFLLMAGSLRQGFLPC